MAKLSECPDITPSFAPPGPVWSGPPLAQVDKWPVSRPSDDRRARRYAAEAGALRTTAHDILIKGGVYVVNYPYRNPPHTARLPRHHRPSGIVRLRIIEQW